MVGPMLGRKSTRSSEESRLDSSSCICLHQKLPVTLKSKPKCPYLRNTQDPPLGPPEKNRRERAALLCDALAANPAQSMRFQ